jgi:hypothetical protein
MSMGNQQNRRVEAHGNAMQPSRDTPPTTAGARAVRQYDIDFQLEKAKRLAIKLHQFPGLFPEDRELIIQLQLAIKKAKKLNGYDPNERLNLFPP